MLSSIWWWPQQSSGLILAALMLAVVIPVLAVAAAVRSFLLAAHGQTARGAFVDRALAVACAVALLPLALSYLPQLGASGVWIFAALSLIFVAIVLIVCALNWKTTAPDGRPLPAQDPLGWSSDRE